MATLAFSLLEHCIVFPGLLPTCARVKQKRDPVTKKPHSTSRGTFKPKYFLPISGETSVFERQFRSNSNLHNFTIYNWYCLFWMFVSWFQPDFKINRAPNYFMYNHVFTKVDWKVNVRILYVSVNAAMDDPFSSHVLAYVCVRCAQTCGDLWLLLSGAVEGHTQLGVADLQLQSLGLRVQWHRQQQPIWVPRPELEANREASRGRCCWWKRQEAAAGAQKGASHQLGLRAREGHVALEDDKAKDTDLHVSSAMFGKSWSHVKFIVMCYKINVICTKRGQMVKEPRAKP